jgi:hypothetical protein
MNDLDPINAFKIQKQELKIRKPRVKKIRGSDIMWSNLCGNQVTHFINCTENLNGKNSYCN